MEMATIIYREKFRTEIGSDSEGNGMELHGFGTYIMTKKTTYDVMLYGKVTLRRREYTKINAMHVCLFRTEPSLARKRMCSVHSCSMGHTSD